MKLKMDSRLDGLLKVTKANYKELIEEYSKRVQNDFGLSKEEKDNIDDLFKKTNERVLSELLHKYSMNISKNIGKKNNYSAETPVIAKRDLLGKEKQYLLSLYLNKLEEYSFDEIGFQDVTIVKKFCLSSKLHQDFIIEDGQSFNYSSECYFLHMTFSPRKDYAKKNTRKSKI